MRRFAELFERLDQTTGTNEKVAALVEYYTHADLDSKVWATLLLRGRVRRTPLTSLRLRRAFLALSGIPEWLLDECHAHVGDSAETIALLMRSGLLPLAPRPVERTLNRWMNEELTGLRALDDASLQQRILEVWNSSAPEHWFLINKLMTGAFRVGVSEKLVLKALAQVSGDNESLWHQWIMGKTDDDFAELREIMAGNAARNQRLQAVPFCLAAPVQENFFAEENPAAYLAEWKWDGIRAQVIHDSGHVAIWSRGEEMITESFPEIRDMAGAWREPVILDGELLVWGDDKPRPFQDLQQRLGRKRLGAETLKKAPATFMAYDLLYVDGQDWREFPLERRRARLTQFVSAHPHPRLRLSRSVPFATWDELKKLQLESRERGAEGLMLKNTASTYVTGRKRGVWWKFKVDPFTLDAVLIYAQAGSGKRSNLFTDYTFALWNKEELVPFAKAYSGLDNQEIEELDRWIRRNTVEKFGPVRSLKLEQVFELAFEGIAPSKRHKSGVAVRFPRILRWRKDKRIEDADHLDTAWKLIASRP